AWRNVLAQVEGAATLLDTQVRGLGEHIAARPEALQRASRSLVELAQKRREELAQLAPWLEVLAAPDSETLEAEVRDELPRPAGLLHWAPHRREIAGKVRQRPASEWRDRLLAALSKSTALDWAETLFHLALRAERFAADMDFRFLFNPTRNLFAIGYNLNLDRLDAAHYHLLASHAPLTSFP